MANLTDRKKSPFEMVLSIDHPDLTRLAEDDRSFEEYDRLAKEEGITCHISERVRSEIQLARKGRARDEKKKMKLVADDYTLKRFLLEILSLLGIDLDVLAQDTGLDVEIFKEVIKKNSIPCTKNGADFTVRLMLYLRVNIHELACMLATGYRAQLSGSKRLDDLASVTILDAEEVAPELEQRTQGANDEMSILLARVAEDLLSRGDDADNAKDLL